MKHVPSHRPTFPFPKIVRRFLQMEASGGLVALLAAAVAMVMANSGLQAAYTDFIGIPISFGMGEAMATEPLKHWINDLFMVFFFLLVGLELKREMVEGFLSRRDQILLPAMAALGGMAVPAAMYAAMNWHIPENMAGWAIASATDIAFALCVLTLVGRTVPPSVKIFLLAIAIFDDLGAILIIAFFYSGALNIAALGGVALGGVALYGLNRKQVRLIAPYLLVGVYLWFCLHHAGIHTTIAGVLVGLFMPMRCPLRHDVSPVNHCIEFLHPWVGFVILPLFAFANAGLHLEGVSLAIITQPLPLGIALALFLGKQIGIFGAVWALIKLGMAAMPEGARWMHLYGVAVLAGIGFTMSLFIGALAFPDAMQTEVKIGVIGGSLLSILWGSVVLLRACRRPLVSPSTS